MPAANFGPTFETLKGVFAKHTKRLTVKTDTSNEYTLVTKSPSPFPQHKGQPMFFASVKLGKAYVSFHLVPLYMNEPLTKTVSPALKKRMQGKACFNFKNDPEPEALTELKRLTASALDQWAAKKWL
jgi:hypothetical protein